MIYYIAQLLVPHVNAFNAFTYLTTRAGGAAVTAFLFSLILGPLVIDRLRRLKIGQYIREEHVKDLHNLHKGKAGTPTMGGSLIIITALIALMLWGRWSNRLLIVSVLVLCTLGAVGFLDDYIKLRRKRNEGLTARAKSLGQIAVGLALGGYLVFNPITVDATYLASAEVSSWRDFLHQSQADARTGTNGTAALLWAALPPGLGERIDALPPGSPVPRVLEREALGAINRVLATESLFTPDTLEGLVNGDTALRLVATDGDSLSVMERVRANRLALEQAYPEYVAKSASHLHTKVGIPGLKDVFIPMGMFYALFVLLIIYGSSNAVNLTDGLDGLAIGASIMSLLAYTGIAYIISRVDWSSYLYLTYVPEATELAVFGAAMLGAGLGFLWFNSHPAEVFMGDTGSLALGGVIGTMAILTKQELLLVLVGGLFVLEAGSVIIQVASYKLRRKRVFKMAPLHHHFELSGWSETKVTIRFWILALVFALMSLGTLKLR